jgi:DNA-binding NarL/FixJ family response regulator
VTDASHPVRVVLVDDQPLVIDELRLALELGGMEVAATAGTRAGTVEAARRLQPDVVVMDMLVLTMIEAPDTLHAAIEAGARGFVVKGATRGERSSGP